ncbi:MAG: MCE family protein [Gemmatimonadetes bacterium]|nr:MAG: MCE family protein [Gemmatimonadota bacterium]
MKKVSATTEFIVGLTVIIALLILIFGTIWMGEIGFRKDRLVINAVFDDIGGLQEGDPVTVAGLNRGIVRRIDLTDSGVLVVMGLITETYLPVDSEVSIQNNGMMGDKLVDFNLGDSRTYAETGHTFYGKYSPGIMEAGDQAQELITHIENLVIAVEQTFASQHRQQQIDSILINLQGATRNAEVLTADAIELIRTNQEHIEQAVTNVRDMTADLKNLVETRRPTVDSTLSGINDVTVQVQTIMTRIDSLTLSLNEIANKINNGDGLVSKVLDDEMLYQDLRTALHNLNELVIDVQKHPRKYLTVELF